MFIGNNNFRMKNKFSKRSFCIGYCQIVVLADEAASQVVLYGNSAPVNAISNVISNFGPRPSNLQISFKFVSDNLIDWPKTSDIPTMKERHELYKQYIRNSINSIDFYNSITNEAIEIFVNKLLDNGNLSNWNEHDVYLGDVYGYYNNLGSLPLEAFSDETTHASDWLTEISKSIKKEKVSAPANLEQVQKAVDFYNVQKHNSQNIKLFKL